VFNVLARIFRWGKPKLGRPKKQE
jgi:hypothetical protein